MVCFGLLQGCDDDLRTYIRTLDSYPHALTVLLLIAIECSRHRSNVIVTQLCNMFRLAMWFPAFLLKVGYSCNGNSLCYLNFNAKLKIKSRHTAIVLFFVSTIYVSQNTIETKCALGYDLFTSVSNVLFSAVILLLV